MYLMVQTLLIDLTLTSLQPLKIDLHFVDVFITLTSRQCQLRRVSHFSGISLTHSQNLHCMTTIKC